MNTNYFDSYEDEQEYRRITGEEQSSRRIRSKTIKQHAEDTKREAKRRDADEALSSAEQLERRRKEFKLEDLLPQQLASACKVMQKSLPVDTLSTLLPLLAGYSGLLKLGTRIAKSHDFHVPCNLYVGVVCISGGCKSPTKQRLIDDPAKDIKQDAKEHHLKNFKLWQEEHQGERKKPPEPIQYLPHLTDYSTAALTQSLVNSEKKRLGQLLIRDELSGLLSAVEADTKKGSGTGEAQLLEAYDGGGYYSIRIEAGSRCYDSCHLSIYGNIQPEALRELINNDDSKGKFARFLFVRLPTGVIKYQDEDPTNEEIAEWKHAQEVLKEYAKKLHEMPPRHYSLNAEARKQFNKWWVQHQITINMPYTAPVIRSLLGKASANALRLTGLLHLIKVAAEEVGPYDQVSATTVLSAMAIVDQLLAETEAFHEEEETPMLLLMRHIHKLSWNNSEAIPVNQQYAKDKGGRAMRKNNDCSAGAFKEAVEALELRGYGVVEQHGKRLEYTATRLMAS
jgi:hypothetical protein